MTFRGLLAGISPVERRNVSHAFERFLVDTSGEGDVEILRTDSEWAPTVNIIAAIPDRNPTYRELININGLAVNGVLKRAIATADMMRKAVRANASNTFAGSGIPKSIERLGEEDFLRALDCMKRSFSTSNATWRSLFSRYYGRQPPAKLQSFLHSGSYLEERSRRDDPRAVLCFIPRFAPNHPSGSVRVLANDFRAILMTQDITSLVTMDAQWSTWDRGNTEE